MSPFKKAALAAIGALAGLLAIAAIVVLLVLAIASSPAAAAVHTSPPGVELIVVREGFVAAVRPDPIGVPTQCFGATGAELLLLPPIATRGQCVAQLRRSLARVYEPPVRRLFARGGLLHGRFTQHAFDGLVSPVYNLGTGLVTCARGFESMCRALHSRSLRAVATTLLLYDHAGGRPFLGLTLRRRAESALIVKPMGRFELWPKTEIRLVQALDALRGHHSERARAALSRLRAHVASRVRRLRRVIHRTHDGLSYRRFDRLRALERRRPRAHAGGAA